MATAARPFRLAVLGLAVLHLLSTAAAAEKNHVVLRSSSFDATTELRSSSVLPNKDTMLTGADRAATSTSTTAPRRLDSSTTAPARSSCRCVCVVVHVHMREVAVDDILPSSSGITTTAATVTKKALLHALPLLAVPFLPPPLAVLLVLFSLAPSVRTEDDSTGPPQALLVHATCTVYHVRRTDQSRPRLRTVRSVACPSLQWQPADPFPVHCNVRTLEGYKTPEGEFTYRVLDDYPPIADPDGGVRVDAGNHVCVVEIASENYRDGYFISCPVRTHHRLPFLSCLPSRLMKPTSLMKPTTTNGTAIHAQA